MQTLAGACFVSVKAARHNRIDFSIDDLLIALRGKPSNTSNLNASRPEILALRQEGLS